LTSTVHDVIEKFRALPVSNRERGERFERLMVQYLQLDPLYAEKFSQVWMWSEWPGRDGKGDTGIDLVAQERESGEFCAIQCKFYEPEHYLQKSDLDSFFTASGKAPFTSRIIISTTERWGRNAEDALDKQNVPVARIGLSDIAAAPVDWDVAWPSPGVQVQLTRTARKELRPHQQLAVDNVIQGFTTRDRGKLIMACGTGKTFTSLKLAEQVAKAKGSPATVLFLVPSISLLSQTLREWTANCAMGLRCFAVCSDAKVGKRSDSEDISTHDLALPATTDVTKLIAQITATEAGAALTVVFSTYQSIEVVAAAQTQGLPGFDLIICDEAHRTTGVTLAGSDESHFVKIHDETFIHGAKRLYMTATPRLFDDTTKTAAADANAVLASMDDEAVFGPEFHRLGFGEAVEKDLLTDYKVLILTVDERHIARSLQAQVADENNEINLDDAVKIVGCWNGLAKRSGQTLDGTGFGTDTAPMRRAVAFSGSIKASKKLTDTFTEVIDGYPNADEDVLRCEVDHVDGTYNALSRNHKLDWLKAESGEGVCRILSNARCLSEGVDVPDLDAVLFLNPRNSVVDVVQSVGRVMRKAPSKDYGYIILPVGIPAGMDPSEALRDNKRYKVVWQVLQALRAHDDRFNATINKIDLNKNKPTNIMVGTVGPGDGELTGDTASSSGKGASAGQQVATQLAMFDVAEWREAIYAKIVTKVGERTYWEDWATDVAAIAQRHTDRIAVLLEHPDAGVGKAFDGFLLGLRNNLNDGISRADAINMLAQHLVTKPVFEALFADYDFAARNPVSQVMQTMLAVLDDQALSKENEALEGFYASVRMRAEGIDNAAGKQTIIKDLYERFFTLAFKKTSESLGIVYTPVEIVDFILRGVNDALRTEFGASLSDEGVHIIDPFTGTGTFIVRLLQSGLIDQKDLLRKYASELHANEILLLAYYIAAINIEATFHSLAGGDYVPFEGIVLTDTFQIHEDDDTMDEVMFPENNARVAQQKALDLRVIITNPPYSAGQTSANDANANLKYPTLDASIERTYVARSTASSSRTSYDSYIRAIRWASNRIGTEGVIGFVSNGGYLDGNSADGLRKTLVEEFSTLYCFNLRGNTRTSGEQARKEGGQIFGSGSRATIAILLAVKNPSATGSCRIYYRDIGDYLTTLEKLATIDASSLDTIDWQTITPNPEGDWINQRNTAFDAYTPLGEKSAKGSVKPLTVFGTYSLGLATGRDSWVYNYSYEALSANTARMIATYNRELERYEKCKASGARPDIDTFVEADSTKISWNRNAKSDLLRSKHYTHKTDAVRSSAYRPFCKQHVYYDGQMNAMRYQLPKLFPTPHHPNVGFYLTGLGAVKPYAALMVDQIPDLNFWGSEGGQFFPRYIYEAAAAEPELYSDSAESGYTCVDNITDAILADYRATYGPAVTKDDIFHYVYGLLHSPAYRTQFAADLKKLLPRIPKVADFTGFATAGLKLSDLHVGYETVTPYPLTETTSGKPTDDERYRVQKMTFGRGKDRSTVLYNAHLTLSGIPEDAYRYMLGSRSAIEWILDRYQVSTHKDSGIRNDPNDWSEDPRYIVDLLKRIVTVSLDTMKIVDALPDLIPVG